MEDIPVDCGQNQYRDAPPGKAVLIGKCLVTGDEDVKTSFFGCLKKFAVLQSCPPI
jgi:hypothetical protein